LRRETDEPIPLSPIPIDYPLLTKSLFVAGHQCLKQLWWRVHESTAKELEPDKSWRTCSIKASDRSAIGLKQL